MERALGFEVKRPATLAEAAALLAALPAARIVAGGTDLVPNLRRGIERPPVLVDLSAVHDFATIVASERGARARRRRHARAHRERSPHRGRVSGAGRGGGERRGTGAPQRRDDRRQPVRRHPLRLLQPERMVAGGERLLPEARRRRLPRGAAGQALPRRILRRRRAGAARARCRDRARREPRHAAHRACGSLPRGRRRAPDARAGRDRGARARAGGVRAARVRVPQGPRARRARLSAGGGRLRGRGRRRRAAAPARRADGHQCAAAPARRYRRPRRALRRRRDARASGQARPETGEPDAHDRHAGELSPAGGGSARAAAGARTCAQWRQGGARRRAGSRGRAHGVGESGGGSRAWRGDQCGRTPAGRRRRPARRADLRHAARHVRRAARPRRTRRDGLAAAWSRSRRPRRGEVAGRHPLGHGVPRRDVGGRRGGRRQPARARRRVARDPRRRGVPLHSRRIARRHPASVPRPRRAAGRLAARRRGRCTDGARADGRRGVRAVDAFVGDERATEGRRPRASLCARGRARRRRALRHHRRGSPVRELQAVLRLSADELPLHRPQAGRHRHPRRPVADRGQRRGGHRRAEADRAVQRAFAVTATC